MDLASEAQVASDAVPLDPPGPGRTGAQESREATDALLGGLRAGGWLPRSWARFTWATTVRSLQQARSHPQALAELTALHGVLAWLARPRRGWVAVSWLMAVTHLGMLGQRRSVGMASALTLVRANLPAVAGDWPWLGVVAVCSDRADGAVARRAGPTQFGHYADSLADAAFWAWFAHRHEPDRKVLAAAAVAWVVPVAAVTVISFTRGEMVEVPRPALVRPAAAMQGLLAVRALRGRPRRPTVTVWRRPSGRSRRSRR